MTVFQKQCVLAYLGYYEGQIDGQWGPLTQAATEAFQGDYGLRVDGVYGDGTHAKAVEIIASKEKSVFQQKREDAGLAPSGPQPAPEDKPVAVPAGDWPDCPNFTRAEFACKCGCGFDNVSHKLVQICQKTRDHFDTPFIPTSGCRCKAHNARVGGVYNSRHMACGDGKGHAVDFYIPGHTAAQVDAFVDTVPSVVYHYMIDGDCVHMDIGGEKLTKEIIVALLGLVGTLAGSFLGVIASQRLTQFRLDKLEKEVAKHNSVVERTFRLEGRMNEAEHDIRDLKGYHKP